jgi:hypothetical protein
LRTLWHRADASSVSDTLSVLRFNFGGSTTASPNADALHSIGTTFGRRLERELDLRKANVQSHQHQNPGTLPVP